MTIIEFPSITFTTVPATWVAPARFDTHVVAELAAWVADNATSGAQLEVDLGECVFVDLFALEALDVAEIDAMTKGASFHICCLSLAAHLTFEMVGGRRSEFALAA